MLSLCFHTARGSWPTTFERPQASRIMSGEEVPATVGTFAGSTPSLASGRSTPDGRDIRAGGITGPSFKPEPGCRGMTAAPEYAVSSHFSGCLSLPVLHDEALVLRSIITGEGRIEETMKRNEMRIDPVRLRRAFTVRLLRRGADRHGQSWHRPETLGRLFGAKAVYCHFTPLGAVSPVMGPYLFLGVLGLLGAGVHGRRSPVPCSRRSIRDKTERDHNINRGRRLST